MSTVQFRATDDERELRLVLDNVPGFVSTMTPTGAIDFANLQLLDYLGVSLEQLQDWALFVHESDRAMVTEGWAAAVADGRAFRAEYRLRRSDGVYRWVDGHAVPVRAQDGSIVRWCSLVVDIEERKQAEDLRRSKERHAILDNIPGLVAIHNASGEPELFNRAAREYHGPCADDPKQWKITDVIHPDDLPCAPRRHASARCRRASHSTPSRACGARTARIDGFSYGRSWCDDYDGTSRWYSVQNRHPRQKTGRGCVAAKRGVSARSAAAQSHWRLALRSGDGCRRELAGDSARVRRSAR